jgi:hypothetical protein
LIEITVRENQELQVFTKDYRNYGRTVAIAITCACLTSCGSSGQGYPDVKVTTAIDQSGVCHHCGSRLERVADSNLCKIGAAQYVICSEKCATEIRSWHASQFGR